MSDPYAPPGSQRDPARADGRRRPPRELPPSAPPPPRREPDPAGAVRTARLGLRFSLLVLAGLVATALPLPWRVGGIAFLLAGGVVGVLALVAAVRARLRASSVVALSVGLAMTTLLVLVQGVSLVFWPLAVQREDCLRGALTETALQACDDEYQTGLQDLVLGR